MSRWQAESRHGQSHQDTQGSAAPAFNMRASARRPQIERPEVNAA